MKVCLINIVEISNPKICQTDQQYFKVVKSERIEKSHLEQLNHSLVNRYIVRFL